MDNRRKSIITLVGYIEKIQDILGRPIGVQNEKYLLYSKDVNLVTLYHGYYKDSLRKIGNYIMREAIRYQTGH